MQNFELSVEESRNPCFCVFKNRNVKYRQISYVFEKKSSKNLALNFKMFGRGDMYACIQTKSFYIIRLVVACGFPRCKPNCIPDEMPEDKMLENKMSENGKPDKIPDNLNRTLTLTSP